MADEEYQTKLESLQKHIPFLNNMIAQLKDPSKKNREAQLNKMESLLAMITSTNKKMKLETLSKCEILIEKLHEKVKFKQIDLEYSTNNDSIVDVITENCDISKDDKDDDSSLPSDNTEKPKAVEKEQTIDFNLSLNEKSLEELRELKKKIAQQIDETDSGIGELKATIEKKESICKVPCEPKEPPRNLNWGSEKLRRNKLFNNRNSTIKDKFGRGRISRDHIRYKGSRESNNLSISINPTFLIYEGSVNNQADFKKDGFDDYAKDSFENFAENIEKDCEIKFDIVTKNQEKCTKKTDHCESTNSIDDFRSAYADNLKINTADNKNSEPKFERLAYKYNPKPKKKTVDQETDNTRPTVEESTFKCDPLSSEVINSIDPKLLDSLKNITSFVSPKDIKSLQEPQVIAPLSNLITMPNEPIIQNHMEVQPPNKTFTFEPPRDANFQPPDFNISNHVSPFKTISPNMDVCSPSPDYNFDRERQSVWNNHPQPPWTQQSEYQQRNYNQHNDIKVWDNREPVDRDASFRRDYPENDMYGRLNNTYNYQYREYRDARYNDRCDRFSRKRSRSREVNGFQCRSRSRSRNYNNFNKSRSLSNSKANRPNTSDEEDSKLPHNKKIKLETPDLEDLGQNEFIENNGHKTDLPVPSSNPIEKEEIVKQTPKNLTEEKILQNSSPTEKNIPQSNDKTGKETESEINTKTNIPKSDVNIKDVPQSDIDTKHIPESDTNTKNETGVLAQFFANLIDSDNKKDKKEALLSLIGTFSSSFSDKQIKKITAIMNQEEEGEKDDNLTREVSVKGEDMELVEQKPSSKPETDKIEDDIMNEKNKSKTKTTAVSPGKRKLKTELQKLQENMKNIFAKDDTFNFIQKRSCRTVSSIVSSPSTKVTNTRTRSCKKKNDVIEEDMSNPEEVLDNKVEDEVVATKLEEKCNGNEVEVKLKEHYSEKIDLKEVTVVLERLPEKIYNEYYQKNTLNEIETELEPNALNCNLCRVCSFKGKLMAQHYRIYHPTEEVFTARLSPESAIAAIADSKLNLDLYESIARLNCHTRQRYQCRFCKYGNLLPPRAFFEHVSLHTGEFRYGCSKCNYFCCYSRSMIHHIGTVHDGNANKVVYPNQMTNRLLFGYICGECYFTQVSADTVKKHSKSHNKNVTIHKVNLSSVTELNEEINKKLAKLEENTRIFNKARKSKRKKSVCESKVLRHDLKIKIKLGKTPSLQRIDNVDVTVNKKDPLNETANNINDNVNLEAASNLQTIDKSNCKPTEGSLLKEEITKNDPAINMEKQDMTDKNKQTKPIKCKIKNIPSKKSKVKVREDLIKMSKNVEIKKSENNIKKEFENTVEQSNDRLDKPNKDYTKKSVIIKQERDSENSLNESHIDLSILLNTSEEEDDVSEPNVDPTQLIKNLNQLFESTSKDNKISSNLGDLKKQSVEQQKPVKTELESFKNDDDKLLKRDKNNSVEDICIESKQKIVNTNKTLNPAKINTNITRTNIKVDNLNKNTNISCHKSLGSITILPVKTEPIDDVGEKNKTTDIIKKLNNQLPKNNEIQIRSLSGLLKETSKTFPVHSEKKPLYEKVSLKVAHLPKQKNNVFPHVIEKLKDVVKENLISTKSLINHDIKTIILFEGFYIRITKELDKVKYACKVKSCLFFASDKDSFIKHCRQHSNIYQKHCEQCKSEIKFGGSMEYVFEHIINHHVFKKPILKSTPVRNQTNKDNSITKVKAPALNIPTSEAPIEIDDDFEIEYIDNNTRQPYKSDVFLEKLDGEPVENYEIEYVKNDSSFARNNLTESTPTIIQNISDDNPFSFKISGVVSLASSSSEASSSSTATSFTEIEMTPAEIKQPKKSKFAMDKFINSSLNLYKCPQFDCSFSTNFKDLFECHINKHRDTIVFVPCVYCMIKTPMNQMSKHIEMRHSHSCYSCGYCIFRTTLKEHIQSHQKEHHPGLDISFVRLPAHTEQQETQPIELNCDDDRPYKCRECDKKFASNRMLQVHLKSHNETNVYECRQCGKCFRLETSLAHHMKTHSEAGLKYKCDICYQIFYSVGLLNHHYNKSHNIKGRLECKICGSIFHGIKEFTTHMMQHKPYKCPVCNKLFSMENILQQHLKTHADELPFSCTKCPRRYKLQINLFKHLETVHKC